jgi:hypothetical protein
VVFLALCAGCAFEPRGGGGDQLVLDGGNGDGGGASDGTTSIDAAPPCPDGDQDGLCDASDPWPCGATQPTVAAIVSVGSLTSASISNVSIGGDGRVVVVTAGAAVTYAASWTLRDSGFCASCPYQLEVGQVSGNRQACVYDANPPQDQTQSGVASVPMTAPTTPGLYALRFQIAQDLSCNAFGRSNWWFGPPPAEATFGLLCVR